MFRLLTLTLVILLTSIHPAFAENKPKQSSRPAALLAEFVDIHIFSQRNFKEKQLFLDKESDNCIGRGQRCFDQVAQRAEQLYPNTDLLKAEKLCMDLREQYSKIRFEVTAQEKRFAEEACGGLVKR